MPKGHHPPTMVPETVFAVREKDGNGWRMLAWECEPEDLMQRIAESMGAVEYRFVGNAHVRKGIIGHFMVERALKAGWHKDQEGDLWFPMDEPLPRYPGSPIRADVSFSLASIMYGYINLHVEADGRLIKLSIDDLDDSLVLFTRFIQILAVGGQPHAALAEKATAHFLVQDGPQPTLCRFSLGVRREGERETVDVIFEREKLLQQFRDLANAIADHPCFAYHYVCHCCLPDKEYDRVDEAAVKEWELGVKEGRYAEEDWDAEEKFIALRIAEAVPLPPECGKLAEEYKTMLRSLEIPEDWLRQHGLATQSEIGASN